MFIKLLSAFTVSSYPERKTNIATHSLETIPISLTR